MAKLHYITHGNVVIDPAVPVPQWGLSTEGRHRVEAMLAQPWITEVSRVLSSGETKARQTAAIVADHVGATVEIRPDLGEIDRSSTGYVSHDEHERLADRFFADPASSASGWERAIDAQDRAVACVADLLLDGDVDIAVIGHGAVGTLLYCHLARRDIDRRHDQPGQGHYWSFDRRTSRLLSGWRPIDRLG